jgi:peptide/nickel transport system permease protein
VRRRRWPPGLAAGVVLLGLAAVVLFGVPLLPLYRPDAQDLSAALAEPFSVLDGHYFLLGADPLGRDLLSRISLGGRVSLLIAGSAVLISLTIGTLCGLMAGYFRGVIENVIMGIADLQLAIPRVLLLIAAAAIVGPSVLSLTVLLGLTSWVSYGRVARALTMALRNREFVLAAETLGASPTWNMRKHLLPNVLPQMVIIASFEFGQIIVLEASLSYLGLGVPPPLPSLGMMINEGQTYLELSPWISLFPGVVIFLMVAGAQFTSQFLTAEGDASADARRAASG